MRFALFSALILSGASLVWSQEQIPLGSSKMPETYTPQTNEEPTLADLLTIEASASIFYTYAREVELSQSFADQAARLTLLVPTNKAVMALARKPHQGAAPPVDTGVVITEEELDARSRENVVRWVSAHIIPAHPLALSSGSHPTLLHGKNVTFKAPAGQPEQPEWAHVIVDDGAHIVAARQAVNGVVYMIDDTVKLD
ncbi:FAS1 domain-containing protein [Phanerochaete sordida]|uniref:FAS1 domain-containing protein n=1 Tax=Phanerochaete sordida TaxID=48140 RepID=A0A9P3LBT8_9APHY|nr:FAS1 domain-containing protein [Phanerochaete sordida]